MHTVCRITKEDESLVPQHELFFLVEQSIRLLRLSGQILAEIMELCDAQIGVDALAVAQALGIGGPSTVSPHPTQALEHARRSASAIAGALLTICALTGKPPMPLNLGRVRDDVGMTTRDVVTCMEALVFQARTAQVSDELTAKLVLPRLEQMLNAARRNHTLALQNADGVLALLVQIMRAIKARQ